MKTKPYKHQEMNIYSSCIMDNTVKGIEFDDSGVFTFCKMIHDLEKKALKNLI